MPQAIKRTGANGELFRLHIAPAWLSSHTPGGIFLRREAPVSHRSDAPVQTLIAWRE